MRIFKNTWFQKFARKEQISDAALCEAVARVEKGLIDADLGGGVLKQRVARPGQGKSGGYRTIILYRQEQRAFFVFGFAKNERENIDREEETHFKKMAKDVLALSDTQIAEMVTRGYFSEVSDDGEDI
ncbi:type II toxin-antitoxin system RelE/ParE family toxin [Phyllobacterium leguminum]|uniref:RelE toxin of RelEB toxin-antitoxin system n=1 Tax=Phyllobacterium leguminum TaxID=314237 RepID=A0A318THU6_9HYPH|nr:type II toxin-antitoxin system RelE/ParE family toxin [Phyllobacterium leguminum]PYE88478.1 hypothetical protein C7477_107121 [Phyllobacterium leguminum]